MIYTRVRAAWRVLMGHQTGGGVPEGSTCSRCADRLERIAELKAEVADWRGRADRAMDALLVKTAGVVGVASTPKGPTQNALAGAITALSVTAINTKRDSSELGQGAMSGAD